jgi:iron complex outermembrane receptor protein
MTQVFSKKLAFGLLVAAAGLISAPSQGQEMEQSAQQVHETVTVTAQKREQDVVDVPIAMNVFSAEAIVARRIEGMEDLSLQVPGLTFGSIAGVGQISLRGIGFGIVSGSGENSVAVHYDGLYIANPGASEMLQSDLAQIEVLRGPQGTLWGRNATAGVVNFVSAAPTEEFEGSALVGYGNLDAVTIKGAVSGPLSDKVRARLSVEYQDRDGYIENLELGGAEGGLERIAGRFSLDWDVTDRLAFELRIFAAQEDIGTPIYDPIDASVFAGGVLPSQVELDPFKTRTNIPSDSKKELYGGLARLTWDISDSVTLTSITGIVDYSFDSTYDGDGTAADLFVVPNRLISDETISQELNVSGSGDRLDWMVGGYYLHQKVDIDSRVPTPGINFLGVNRVDNITSEKVDSYAVFADVTYSLTDRFRIYGGLRYLKEDRSFVQTQVTALDVGLFVPPPAGPTLVGVFVDIPTCPGLEFENSDDHVTGRAGVQVDVGEAMVYGQYSTGYKSGGFASSTCNDPFEPEKLKAFEIGVKSEAFGGSTLISAAIFYYDYADLQVEEVVTPNIFVNNADAEVWGGEIDVTSQLTDTLQLNFGFIYLDTKFTEFTNLDLFNPQLGFQDLSGNPLLRAPKWQLNLGIEQSFQLANNALLVLRGDLLASDSFQLREFNETADAQKSYVTGNIIVAVEFGDKFTVRGWVKNIANTAILGGIVNSGAAAPSRNGSFGLSRTFGADIAVRF